MLCWISNAAQVAITPPSGWTVLGTMFGSNAVYFAYRWADSEPSNYAWTWTDSRGTGIITTFSGVDATQPMLAWQGYNALVTGDQLAPALSNVASDPSTAMLVSFFNWDIGAQATTPPSGFTIPTNGNPDSGTATGNGVESAIAYMAYTGGSGIGTADWNTTSTRICQVVQLALLPSGFTDDLLAAWYSVPSSSTSTTSLSVTMPNNIATGDLLICCVGWKGDSVTTSMSGWTQEGTEVTLVDGGGLDLHHAIFYKYATSPSESGTLTVSSANAATVTPILIKRVGTSGDPFLDYQTLADATDDTASDYPALTVSTQQMLSIATISRRGDSAITAIPSGYATFADPVTQTPLYARPGASSTGAIVGTAVQYQTAASPGAGAFTHNSSAISVGIHFAVSIGAEAATGRSFAYIMG
jgi:hypothetical protein